MADPGDLALPEAHSKTPLKTVLSPPKECRYITPPILKH